MLLVAKPNFDANNRLPCPSPLKLVSKLLNLQPAKKNRELFDTFIIKLFWGQCETSVHQKIQQNKTIRQGEWGKVEIKPFLLGLPQSSLTSKSSDELSIERIDTFMTANQFAVKKRTSKLAKSFGFPANDLPIHLLS